MECFKRGREGGRGNGGRKRERGKYSKTVMQVT